ncbi:hypothetical protein LPJ60_001330 [Coemansia sp. RSA 2675]|nr:hypothetical protein LPJ60_001330 [Coemansia sp. RSA 2675]KAJ2415679.1 hypothetical protein GGI10_001524 [Coemansia sp. RSA 2530]KAJ2697728.1 hypothetical protein H4218_003758 [Coemansia sp. IMI 209128]
MPNAQMDSANKPLSSDGRTYHVETRPGEVANRIVTVGDPQRARIMAQQLDSIVFEHSSHRGFLTITGLYRNVPLSIVAIGMGLSMMDFFVRETRMVVDGPLSIVRFGSCGSICDARVGDVIVADAAFGINRNYDYFDSGAGTPYRLSSLEPGDGPLTELLAGGMAAVGPVVRGAVGNADSFYGSQGRTGDDFYDANDGLVAWVREQVPGAVALEMESHMLFHLARVSTGRLNDRPPSVRAGCALLVFADRTGNSFISPEMSTRMVIAATKAVFDALVADSK